MKTYVLSFAIATLAAGALAGAQTPPSSSSSTSPSSSQSSSTTTTQTPSGSSSSSYSSSSGDSKAQLKDCMAKQKNMNPQISDADAKKACKTE